MYMQQSCEGDSKNFHPVEMIIEGGGGGEVDVSVFKPARQKHGYWLGWLTVFM